MLSTVFEAVVMVSDQTSLIEAAERLDPKLVVVDICLVREDIHGFLCRLRASSVSQRVIFLSEHEDTTVARSVLAAGADGLVIRRRLASDLLPAVDAVLRGERYGLVSESSNS